VDFAFQHYLPFSSYSGFLKLIVVVASLLPKRFDLATASNQMRSNGTAHELYKQTCTRTVRGGSVSELYPTATSPGSGTLPRFPVSLAQHQGISPTSNPRLRVSVTHRNTSQATIDRPTTAQFSIHDPLSVACGRRRFSFRSLALQLWTISPQTACLTPRFEANRALRIVHCLKLVRVRCLPALCVAIARSVRLRRPGCCVVGFWKTWGSAFECRLPWGYCGEQTI
jgi:hypothetical protein